MIDDVTTAALQTALSGLAQRQQVTANNIANVETPGFTASQVSFEQSLASAVSDGNPAGATVSVSPTTGAANAQGNNVDLSDELVTATQTTLQEQLLANSITGHYANIDTVLKS